MTMTNCYNIHNLSLRLFEEALRTIQSRIRNGYGWDFIETLDFSVEARW